MRQLLLLRHAKSSWDDSSISDRDRPLNNRGRRSVARMRLAMHEHGLAPDLILVSTAKRTMQTLDALEPWDDVPLIEPMDSLYLASATQLLDALRGVADTVRSVMLIGHNPGMHDLALALAAPAGTTGERAAMRSLAEGFPTCALAEFTVPAAWSLLGPGGGRLQRFLTPRGLEAAD
jgi:phosphohistidine phosphatase